MPREISPDALSADQEMTDPHHAPPHPPLGSSSVSATAPPPAAAAAAALTASARGRRVRSRDVVLLNVGGKVFTTSTGTLCSDSAYFKSMFSDRWSGAGGTCSAYPGDVDGSSEEEDLQQTAREQPYFIDQDPEPFSVLLTYMRGGGINMTESNVVLSRQVILQAQFFGVDGFLRSVRARAYRNNHADFVGSDDQATEEFDKEYGGISEAIESGELPQAYFRAIPDHVVINAGGTTFETSKRTLTERSPYFERLFKSSPREKTYFLDVDPAAFEIMLKYMRHAEFDLPRNNVALFRCVLALAQRFEIRGFIEYVKARTYAIQSGHDPREYLTFLDRHHHPIEDSDNADAFHSNYEGIDEAFVTGVLPDGFFEEIKKT